MFQNKRIATRIPCDGDGYLVLGDERPASQIVDLSKGGACLRVDLEVWAGMEDLEHVDGGVSVGGQDFTFTGRICWSLVEDEKVRFGLEFLVCDRRIIEGVLEDISVITEDVPDNSFNL